MTSRATRRAAQRAGIPLTTPDPTDASTDVVMPAIPSRARAVVTIAGVVLGAVLACLLAAVPVVLSSSPWWWMLAAAGVGALVGGGLLGHAMRPGGAFEASARRAPEDAHGVVDKVVHKTQEVALEEATNHLQAPPADALTLLTKAGWRCARPDSRLPFVVAASAKGAILLAATDAAQAHSAGVQIADLAAKSPELAALPVVLVCLGGPAPRLDGLHTCTRAKLLATANMATRA